MTALTPPTVRAATSADRDAVGRCLGAAFAADPVWEWALGSRVDAVVRAIVGLGVEQEPEHFTIVGHVTSVAWWHPPGEWKLPLRDVLRLLPRALPAARLGAVRLLRLSSMVERQHPRGRHHYLGWLGSHPSAQGMGHGALALAPGLAACDADGLPAYLESSNPRNLPFYRRHGFVDLPLLKVPKGCPPLMPMWREPR